MAETWASYPTTHGATWLDARMPDLLTEVALVLLPPALGAYVLYWVIRLGVRHGLRDVERAR